MAEYTQILLDVADGVATLTLNRPHKMNAYTRTMMAEMVDAFDQTDADDSVRAVIVTGAGDRAFCAGADLTPDNGVRPFSDPTEVADLSDPLVRDSGGLCTLRIFNSKKPVIGAINGAAVGIGATMQLPMDFRLASTSARFGFVFARRGIDGREGPGDGAGGDVDAGGEVNEEAAGFGQVEPLAVEGAVRGRCLVEVISR